MKNKLILLATTIVLALAFTNCSDSDKDKTLSSEKSIESFRVNNKAAKIDQDKKYIELIVATEDLDLSKITPEIHLSYGATVSPASGAEQDFSNHLPKKYTVTAQDRTTQEYTVVITTSELSAAFISKFDLQLPSQVVVGKFTTNQTTNENNITLTVPYGTDVTKLSPSIDFKGKSISPEANKVTDFTNPVVYTVTSEGALTVEYIVTVIVGGDYYLEKTDGTVIARGEVMTIKGRFAKEGNIVKIRPRYESWQGQYVEATTTAQSESEIKFIIPNGDAGNEKALYGYNRITLDIDGIIVDTDTQQAFDIVVPNLAISSPLQIAPITQTEYTAGLDTWGDKSILLVKAASTGSLGKSGDSQIVTILTNKVTGEEIIKVASGIYSTGDNITSFQRIFERDFPAGDYTMVVNAAAINSEPVDITVKPYPYQVPVLESISSFEVKKSDVITIKGKNFTEYEATSKTPSLTVAYWTAEGGSKPLAEADDASFTSLTGAKIISHSDTEIKFSIADLDLKGNTKIYVRVVANNSAFRCQDQGKPIVVTD